MNPFRIIACFALALALCGCVDSATRAEIKKLDAATTIQEKKIDDNTAILNKQVEANPSQHLILAGQNVAKGIRSWAIVGSTIALVGIGVFLGLKFTPVGAVSAIGLPVCVGVFAVLFVGAIALPVLTNVWIELVAGLGVLGLGVYESVKNKSAIGGIITSLESEIKPALGIKTPPPAPVPSPALAASLPIPAVK